MQPYVCLGWKLAPNPYLKRGIVYCVAAVVCTDIGMLEVLTLRPEPDCLKPAESPRKKHQACSEDVTDTSDIDM
jgi:hypothetical protein